jgi:hypothetical protein
MDSTGHQTDDRKYIEVWNDLVSPRDLTWSLVICGGTTAAALLISQALGQSAFFWGLGGSVGGFIVTTLLITPKRVVRLVDGPSRGVAGPAAASDDPDASAGTVSRAATDAAGAPSGQGPGHATVAPSPATDHRDAAGTAAPGTTAPDEEAR